MTATGFAIIRWKTGGEFQAPWAAKYPAQAIMRVGFWCFAAIPLLGSWTIGLLILRLRRPRPTLRRITRQPGFSASLAVLTCFLLEAVTIALIAGFGGKPHQVEVFFILGLSWAVGVAWSGLLVGGRWRPERGWIDGTGRVMGFVWLVLPTIAFVAVLMD